MSQHEKHAKDSEVNEIHFLNKSFFSGAILIMHEKSQHCCLFSQTHGQKCLVSKKNIYIYFYMIYCHFFSHQILIADVMAGGSYDYFVINCDIKKIKKIKVESPLRNTNFLILVK